MAKSGRRTARQQTDKPPRTAAIAPISVVNMAHNANNYELLSASPKIAARAHYQLTLDSALAGWPPADHEHAQKHEVAVMDSRK